MDNLFKKIKYFILSFQEKFLLDKLKSSTKRNYVNKTTKKVIGNAADLTLNSETLKLIEKAKENVTAIAKQTNCDPQALLDYIKAAKTPVFKVAHADKFLNLIKEEEGLIYEKKGIVALYLSLITKKQFQLSTEPMFILREGNIDKHYMLHHFYRWYSLKLDLPGFDYDTQKKFKASLFKKLPINKLSIEDIYAIKEAVARDQEATDFVLEFAKLTDGSRNAHDKIKTDKGANI
ncbi:MAG: hypothetical protein E7Z87_01140 [Cyanobacteria bacterium SIG26]|nr:hypothetical protein [Cyanobacteria bacterium SIG26]